MEELKFFTSLMDKGIRETEDDRALNGESPVSDVCHRMVGAGGSESLSRGFPLHGFGVNMRNTFSVLVMGVCMVSSEEICAVWCFILRFKSTLWSHPA